MQLEKRGIDFVEISGGTYEVDAFNSVYSAILTKKQPQETPNDEATTG